MYYRDSLLYTPSCTLMHGLDIKLCYCSTALYGYAIHKHMSQSSFVCYMPQNKLANCVLDGSLWM